MKRKFSLYCLTVSLLTLLVISVSGCGNDQPEKTSSLTVPEKSSTSIAVAEKEAIPKVTAGELIEGVAFHFYEWGDPALGEKVKNLDGKMVEVRGRVEIASTYRNAYVIIMKTDERRNSYNEERLKLYTDDEDLVRKLKGMNLQESETIIATGTFRLLQEMDYDIIGNKVPIFGAKISPLKTVERP